MKQFVIYLLGLIFWLAAPAASAQKQVADSLYAAEKFQQAAAEYEKLLKDGKQVDAECKLRLADQENGYAEGIRQALACIGFTHERMKELDELL